MRKRLRRVAKRLISGHSLHASVPTSHIENPFSLGPSVLPKYLTLAGYMSSSNPISLSPTRGSVVTRTHLQFRRAIISCRIPFPHRYICGCLMITTSSIVPANHGTHPDHLLSIFISFITSFILKYSHEGSVAIWAPLQMRTILTATTNSAHDSVPPLIEQEVPIMPLQLLKRQI